MIERVHNNSALLHRYHQKNKDIPDVGPSPHSILKTSIVLSKKFRFGALVLSMYYRRSSFYADSVYMDSLYTSSKNFESSEEFENLCFK